ncbi:MAG: diguanylate cyclase [Candidatus Gastranaerophilales bacterium]|nr:diguanylate cyclase [Candidatus Gastranaerophilales bacterium]MCM1072837.1 diguanylate cyclase [Bacteroides sp.]
MGFFDNIKNIKKEIDRVESSVYSGKQSLMEVYERNVKLEAEIAVRTKELDTANRQMLTLQHIWDMMNSSKPLSSVLNAIVNSLQGELGYLHSCIAKRLVDKDGIYLQLVACSGELFGDNFIENFNCEPCDLRMKFPDIEELSNTIEKNQIYHSKDIKTLLKNVIPNQSDEFIEELAHNTNAKSYVLVPLAYKHSHFGSLLVFSSREEATENELNFLNLFAKQIELAITIADLFQAVKEQAVTDGMTGLFNRRYFEEFIKKEAIRANRQNQKFTVIGLDLDHLKRINDKYGHNYGDIAIKAIAEVLKSSCRSIDIAARMGGEEFNVILSGVDSQGGLVFAERIRKTIEAIQLEKIGNITASIGVGTYFEHSEDIDELLELVDNAMYSSKRNGRNRVTLATPITETSWQEVAISTFVDILSKHQIPIDSNTSKLLDEKLQEMSINNDIVYQVSDELVATYNPEHTEGGTKRKVLLATLLAKRFDLPKESIDKLKIAILLYDIGNTMLPKELLNKKEPLSEEDRISIKQHPIIAAREILQPISRVNDIIPIIEKHHENWNGTGYPCNISGDAIPIESQIILIIDSYFALMENRPYRAAMSKDEAIKTILDEANSKWSDKLATEFVEIVKEDI